MKFEISPDSQHCKRKVIYSNQEHSFDMDTYWYTDFTIMLGCAYIGLDVDLSSLEVVNVSGFCPSENWIKKPLCTPVETCRGTIKIVSNSDMCEGTGTYLFDEAVMYFDEDSRWCYIDGMTRLLTECNVRFCENVMFSLCGNALVGVWIHLGDKQEKGDCSLVSL